MIKTILIIAGVIIGAPIAIFIIFIVAVIINFLIQPEINSSGMIIECRGCPGLKTDPTNGRVMNVSSARIIDGGIRNLNVKF